MTNPIANAGQFAAEKEVIDAWDLPQVRAARAHVAQLWRVGHGVSVPPEVEKDFDGAMDAWLANYMLRAAAMDPVQPRFVRALMPAYEWHGMKVPDNRMGGDNPDNCYRLAGIAHGGRYRVTGQVVDKAPAHGSYTLVENWGTSITADMVELADLDIDQDGVFTITIDSEPANGRRNHLTTTPRVKFLFVRDSMMDWERETPIDLTIERLDRVAEGPLDPEFRLEEGLRRVREDVPLYYWFFRLSQGVAVNTLPQPMRTASVGGLITQATGIGHLHLEDDQAAIVRFAPAGAAYNSLQTAMWWYRSPDAHLNQAGLTAAQAVVDAEGWITAVISAQDPGIANWVQTGGYKDLLPMVRWQGIRANAGGLQPQNHLQIVSFKDLDRHLPQDIVRITAEERVQQLARRRASWDRRTTE